MVGGIFSMPGGSYREAVSSGQLNCDTLYHWISFLTKPPTDDRFCSVNV